mmetsp:Transcript_11224/g.19813  ORF Transcript_11224/g.19813 Transcript_11224/m.19813 type:complete len:240 (+) Transcript_11224:62-781(+)
MALGLPPGRLRRNISPFQGTFLEDRSKWTQLHSEATSRINTNAALQCLQSQRGDGIVCSISASDRDGGAVEATRANAKRAGVLKSLKLEQVAVSNQPWFARLNQVDVPQTVLVACNPPFGRRVSREGSNHSTTKKEKNHLLPLYQRLVDCIHRLVQQNNGKDNRGRDVRLVILTDDPRFVRSVVESANTSVRKTVNDSGSSSNNVNRTTVLDFRPKIILKTSHGGINVAVVSFDVNREH